MPLDYEPSCAGAIVAEMVEANRPRALDACLWCGRDNFRTRRGAALHRRACPERAIGTVEVGMGTKRPAANHSAEARALRAAALAFARQPEEPIDGYDTLGARANARLLKAARAYAKRAGCADCGELLRVFGPLWDRIPTGDEVRAAEAVALKIKARHDS